MYNSCLLCSSIKNLIFKQLIKYIRKIRYDLMEKNKIGKYLKYAVGEIILVVIGILIALQINNWNENRKSKIMANELYTNLLTSLEQDSIEVQRTIDLLTKSLETQRKLILSKGVYDVITSNNSLDLLQSKKIKALLINLYDFQYKRYENVDAIIDHKYHYQLGSLIRKKIG